MFFTSYQIVFLQLHIYSRYTKISNNYSFSENVKISTKNIQNLETLFEDSIISYKYKYPSVKKSLFSLPLTYMGFSGYINPFTNEANINYNIPASSQVFVINHEIAHQLGIASEKDAQTDREVDWEVGGPNRNEAKESGR